MAWDVTEHALEGIVTARAQRLKISASGLRWVVWVKRSHRGAHASLIVVVRDDLGEPVALVLHVKRVGLLGVAVVAIADGDFAETGVG